MFLEVFVVATSLVLGCFLLVLTAVTQLQTYAASRDGRPTLTALLVAGFRKNRRNRPAGAAHITGDPSTTGDGRSPGKKARRTERRRQKHALVNINKSVNKRPLNSQYAWRKYCLLPATANMQPESPAVKLQLGLGSGTQTIHWLLAQLSCPAICVACSAVHETWFPEDHLQPPGNLEQHKNHHLATFLLVS